MNVLEDMKCQANIHDEKFASTPGSGYPEIQTKCDGRILDWHGTLVRGSKAQVGVLRGWRVLTARIQHTSFVLLVLVPPANSSLFPEGRHVAASPAP